MKETAFLVDGVKELSTNWQTMYDYFKHVTTLSLGALLFISAFLKNDKTSVIQEISIMFSVLAFLACIWTSLMVMTNLGNMMLYYSGIQGMARLSEACDKDDKDYLEQITKIKNKVLELVDKTDQEEPKLKKWTRATRRLLLTGGVFSSIFVLSPIIYKLLVAIGVLRSGA